MVIKSQQLQMKLRIGHHHKKMHGWFKPAPNKAGGNAAHLSNESWVEVYIIYCLCYTI